MTKLGGPHAEESVRIWKLDGLTVLSIRASAHLGNT